MSLLITLFFLAFVGLFIFDGYRNGLYYGLTRLATLVLIFLLAKPIGSLFSNVFQNIEQIPPMVRPHVAMLMVAMVLFIVGAVASHVVWKRTMKMPENPTKEQLKEVKKSRTWGMAMGGLIGAILGVILFIVFYNLGWVAEEVHRGEIAELEDLEAPPAEESPSIDVSKVEQPVARAMIQLKKGIKDSLFGGLVEVTNPVEKDDYELARRMLGLMNDPVKLDEFRRHPNMQEVIRNPHIAELLEDDEIRRLVLAKDYKALLYNQKLADLVHDEELVDQIKRANVRQVLEDIERKNSDGK